MAVPVAHHRKRGWDNTTAFRAKRTRYHRAMIKPGLVVAVLLASSACGGDDEGGGGGSDAGGGGDGGGGQGPAIGTPSPADGDSMVSVLADIEVSFTGDLDPASVTADSVQLWKVNGSEIRLFGPVSYDAESRAVTLTPFDAFDHFSNLEVRLTGLAGDGGAVADAAIHFSTTQNLVLRQTSYSANGLAITGWDGQDHDEWGYEVRYTHYTGPGDNGEWYTDDDDANLRIETERDDQHRPVRVDIYSGAALDLVQYRLNTFDDRGDMTLEVTYDPDDAIVMRRASTYDAGHRLLRGTSFNGAGDDDVSFAEGYVYDADGLTVRRAVYASPGDDGVWGNDNDVPNSWLEYRYTPERRLDGARGDPVGGLVGHRHLHGGPVEDPGLAAVGALEVAGQVHADQDVELGFPAALALEPGLKFGLLRFDALHHHGDVGILQVGIGGQRPLALVQHLSGVELAERRDGLAVEHGEPTRQRVVDECAAGLGITIDVEVESGEPHRGP